MKPAFYHLQIGLALAVLLAMTSGCATPALWRATATRTWQPHSLDQIFLISKTNQPPDVVIFFTQLETKGKFTFKTRKVGWSISQPTNQVATTSKAIRELTNSASSIQAVPCCLPAIVPAKATIQPPGYAVWNMASDQITIHIAGIPSGPYALPASKETHYILRIVFLPIAITTDAVILTAAAIGEGGGKFSH